MQKKFPYGGMAVIEGVMMRGPARTSIAVRKSDGTIQVDEQPNNDWAKRFPFLKWPFIRGTFVLIESLVVGIKMLNHSANLALDEDEDELSFWEILITMVVAFGLAILLFMVLPTAIVHYLQDFLAGPWAQNLVEGFIRIAFFFLYVIAISRMPDIARVFMYHGAEHKTIFAYEAGEPLTVDNVKRHSSLHPRCGTSFLLIVMIISIVVFALLGEGSLWYRIWSRLAVLPIVAGLGYEFLKLSGRYYGKGWLNFLIAPGLWMQRLTTREPDHDQMEVAIAALQRLLDDETKNPPAEPQVEQATG
ncbi:MAG TPA: DUF1385 domain-containing protein [Syntrophomonas sp.]|jgi:uncharacterized protein YqhQ|nr:DUF1385 domain-containing protein [Syntrophomonas sp.]